MHTASFAARRPHRRRGRLAHALVALALVSCGGDSGTGPAPGQASAIQVVSGSGQSGRVNEELPAAIVVRVVDAAGHPVAGQGVSFVVTQGGGHVYTGSGTSNADGLVQERWTLGTAVGANQLEARGVNSATGDKLSTAVITASATAGAAAALAKSDGDAQTGPAGGALPTLLAVLVKDAYGNVVPGVTVAWAATGGGGSLAPASSTTGADGIARATWTLGTGLGAQVATATVAGMPAVTFGATAVGAAPTRLDLLAGNGQSVTVDNLLPTQLAVTARDSYGNVVAGASVTWTVTGGGGKLVPVQATTDASGVARAVWLLGSSPGANTAQASVAGVTPVSFSATGTAANAAAARSWTAAQARTTSQGSTRVWTSGATDVWAAGYGPTSQSGLAIHNDGAGWGRPPGSSLTSDTKEVTAIWGSGPTDVWAAASNAPFRYNGSAWTPVDVPAIRSSDVVPAITGSGPTDVWLICTCLAPNSLMHNTGSGFVGMADADHYYGSFDKSLLTSAGPNAVYVVAEVVSTSLHDLAYVTSTGVTHTPLQAYFAETAPFVSTISVQAMWAAGPNDLFLSTNFGMLRFDGTTFTRMTTPANQGISAMWGSSASDVYAVGTAGVILHFDGTAWRTESSGTSEWLTSVWGTTAGAPVYVGTDMGRVLTGIR
ncbi:MAG TPA: Ig-like domain-containing protein [Gemmatimonadaceae bacterium]|nr:Ig-like domain-containing protein [Gemmatimonadaceae bacterium]